MVGVRRISYRQPTNIMYANGHAGGQPTGGSPSSQAAGGDNRADEPHLAAAIARGDIDAFNTFYQLYVDRLYRVIFYQLDGQRADAEDVLQETMLAAVKAMPAFRGQSRLFTWLCGIAQHKITDHRRRRGAHGEKVPLPLQDTDLIFDDETNALVEDAETRVLVRQALAALSETHRQVLILKYLAGLSVEEIAASTGRSFKAVESLLSRARDALRLALEMESIHVD
jgi:RNA polymerase sigma-70 factor, ECF subfamily